MKKISKVSENLKNSKTAEKKPKPRGGMPGVIARATSNIRAKTNLPLTRDTEEKPRRSLMQKIQVPVAKRFREAMARAASNIRAKTDLPPTRDTEEKPRRSARFEKGGSVNKRSKSSCK